VSLRIDLGARTIAVSPASLLGGASRRIGLDRGEGFERRWIGQAVHRRVLDDSLREIPGYRPEQTVRFTFPVDDFTATFEGRVDGRYEEAGRVVVDEVKSLHFAEDLAKLPGSPRLARFQLQLGWYLHAISVAEGREVTGRLVLADIETAATRVVPLAHDPERFLTDLVERVRSLIDAHLGSLALAEAKAAEADSLAFPFERYRPGQREMAAAVSRAVAQGDHLLVEAPTGIGKTAAALYPLVRGALRDGRRVYVLTAKNTQQEIFTKTLDAVEGDSFRSIRLRAKERMCANDVVLCHEDHCPYAKDYGAKLESSGILDRLTRSFRHLEPDVVFEEARREALCPFEVSLELAEEADIVVGDYNYVFDPIVSLSGARDPSTLEHSFLLIDEAHNLVDRGRGYYSPQLQARDLQELERSFGVSSAKTAAEAADAARSLCELVEEAARSLAGEEAAELVAVDPDRLDDLRLGLESLLVRHLADVRATGERIPDDPVLELYFTFARFHDVHRIAVPAGIPDKAFDVIAQRGPGGPRLSILCKDPSRQLGPIVNGAATTVAMSATLTPPEFFRDLLGFDPERTGVLRLPSPFPAENRIVLITPDIDTRYQARGGAVPALAGMIAGVAGACPGNVLALFPSYRFLDDVRARLPSFPARRVLRPSDRSTELERNGALAALRDGGPPVLLLAVSGGAFAEGVDYPGEMLSAVVVVSPALPQFRFEQERMKSYFEERFEKGFEYAYVIPGMTRVVQSAGRLIRSESDVGVVVLACRRFLKAPYDRYLPGHWFVDSPRELATDDIASTTAAFFERVRRGELPVAPEVPLLAGGPRRSGSRRFS